MKVTGLHLEPTNKCTLKCPRCSRTTFIDKFGISKWKPYDLSLVNLKRFVDIPMDGINLTLCGNTGDPIYYSDLLELISWAKNSGATISLKTNGSYKTESWWRSINQILTGDDRVEFAIDGTPENFLQYRINADWKSIETGVNVMTSGSAKVAWKYIPFSFNYKSIDCARELSKLLGVDEFNVVPSDRWISATDPLRPTDYVGSREVAIMNWYNGHRNNEVDPKCISMQNQHYISAEGFYTPCCYAGDYNFYYKSEFYKNRTQYDISTTTLTQILELTQQFYHNITQNSPNYCTFNCPKK